jgi:hypothetical protein
MWLRTAPENFHLAPEETLPPPPPHPPKPPSNMKAEQCMDAVTSREKRQKGSEWENNICNLSLISCVMFISASHMDCVTATGPLTGSSLHYELWCKTVGFEAVLSRCWQAPVSVAGVDRHFEKTHEFEPQELAACQIGVDVCRRHRGARTYRTLQYLRLHYSTMTPNCNLRLVKLQQIFYKYFTLVNVLILIVNC